MEGAYSIDLDCDVVGSNGQTLLDDADISQQERVANRQMRLPAQDSRGRTVLHLAALTANSGIISMAGNFNAQDHCGCTPLHSMMTVGSDVFDERVFNLLVSKCDVNAVNNDGQTALHMAASHDINNASHVKGLINAGARYVNCRAASLITTSISAMHKQN